ncbi:MAG: bifunctional riboflavin kinase/FAD synthetase [Geminicoccaceae bacterium]
MRVHRGFSASRSDRDGFGAAVAIGNFDGVHRGHRAVIEAARRHAVELGTDLGVITFEPHPREVLQGMKAPERLSPLRTKVERLRELDVRQLYVLPFTRSLMSMSAEAFVEDVLIGSLGVKAVVAGADFRFGHKRSGDIELMRRIAAHHGVRVDTASTVSDSAGVISSTRIRAALAEGRVADAGHLLGYDYEIVGRVRTGDRRGRELGFPTANTYPLHPRTAMPANGIYAVRAALVGSQDGSHPVNDAGNSATVWHPGAASLGTNPTFDGRERRLEVHLLDGMDYDLYGRRLRVAFIDRLRGEERFASIDSLIAQMNIDCDRAREILAAPAI